MIYETDAGIVTIDEEGMKLCNIHLRVVPHISAVSALVKDAFHYSSSCEESLSFGLLCDARK
jgi:hypothetical protein